MLKLRKKGVFFATFFCFRSSFIQVSELVFKVGTRFLVSCFCNGKAVSGIWFSPVGPFSCLLLIGLHRYLSVM